MFNMPTPGATARSNLNAAIAGLASPGCKMQSKANERITSYESLTLGYSYW